MKLITTVAVALGAAFAAAPVVAQTAQPPAQAPALNVRPSAKALKAISELQDSVNKKDWANVPVKVAAAQAVASTNDDRYLIGALQLRAAALMNDTAAFASALESLAPTGRVNAATMASFYSNLAGTYLKKSQFTEAAAAYQKAIALDPSRTDLLVLQGEAQSAAGQKAEASATFQRAVQARTAAGQKPDEDLIRRAVATAYEAKLPAAAELARQWVAAYPSPTSWSNALAIYSNATEMDDEGRLALFRLMQATGGLNNAVTYGKYVAAAFSLNNYNEAQSVLDAGIAAKVINPGEPDFREIITALKAKPKATTADLEVATKTAVNGMALLRIGDRYYAMANYAKAVELYRMAMGKPGVDANVVNLHIGMALARSGDKVGATAALNAVSGPRAELAKYWLLYANQGA